MGLEVMGRNEAGRGLKPSQRDCGLQELVFLEERCEDNKALKDYGINNDFIVQVLQTPSWSTVQERSWCFQMLHEYGTGTVIASLTGASSCLLNNCTVNKSIIAVERSPCLQIGK